VGYYRLRYIKIRELIQVARPTEVLFAFVFLTQFVTTLYALREVGGPWLYEFLYPIALSWIMWWWLQNDCKRTGINWPLDFGLLLYVAWMIVVPYHLFKTRGFRGLAGIAAFIGILIAGTVCGAVLGVLIWY